MDMRAWDRLHPWWGSGLTTALALALLVLAVAMTCRRARPRRAVSRRQARPTACDSYPMVNVATEGDGHDARRPDDIEPPGADHRTGAGGQPSAREDDGGAVNAGGPDPPGPHGVQPGRR
jgi:hypothetical protein